jgi:hypothetical protein
MGGTGTGTDLNVDCLRIIAQQVPEPSALFQTCKLFSEIAKDMGATATAMNLIIKKERR